MTDLPCWGWAHFPFSGQSQHRHLCVSVLFYPGIRTHHSFFTEHYTSLISDLLFVGGTLYKNYVRSDSRSTPSMARCPHRRGPWEPEEEENLLLPWIHFGKAGTQGGVRKKGHAARSLFHFSPPIPSFPVPLQLTG